MIYFQLAQLEGLSEFYAAITLNPGIKEILPTVSLGTLSNHITKETIKSELLVLDEATSFLDNENEYKIQKVLENLQGRLTIVIIAYRLSNISNADKIIVIDNGKIVESGSFITLLNKEPDYFRRMLGMKQDNKSYKLLTKEEK